MKLVNSEREPELLGVECSEEDWKQISQIVANLNQDLIDSGYERYQAKALKKKDSIYIKTK
jgi:hypothetical protein